MKFAARRAPENGNSQRAADGRDAEIERLKGELDRAQARERAARSELASVHKRFNEVRSTSRAFAATMHENSAARRRSGRRIAAQYAVGRVLAEAGELEEASTSILQTLVRELGLSIGVYWSMDDDDRLGLHALWPAQDGPQGEAFEDSCRELSLRRGEGLPGRAWAAGRPVWIEDVLTDERFHRRPAAGDPGLRSALAFPARDGGRTAGVFELFWDENAPPDEELLRVTSAIGGQIGQFAERRRAEKERERLYARERAARTEAEAARRRTVEVLESMGDAFFSFDPDWRFTYMNAAASEIIRKTGKDPDRLPGKVLWEEIPEILGTKFETEMRRAVREGAVVEYEEYLRPLGGWLGARVYPSEAGVSTYVRDVTEGRRTREALRRSEERWRTLIEKGADVITISDHDGTIRFASPSVETVCGYRVDEFVGTNPFEAGHIHPDDLERCEAAFRELEDNPGHSVTIQHRYRHGSGEWRWLEGTFTNLFEDPAIGGLVANFRDVTERKRAEAERDRLLAQEWVARAEVAERERISRELHDRVAHSMAVVHQSLQLYEVLAAGDPSRAAPKLETAKEMARTALDSTRDLSAELRRSDAEEDLEQALHALLEVSVPPNVRTQLSVEGDESLVPGRARGQLFLILREAVRNAVSHSGCRRVTVALRFDGSEAVGSVQDDGRGFEPDDGDLSGVGLSSMRERAQLLGGALSVRPVPGEGTRVEVSMPLGRRR
jgi:PAS domain S-box-containing protein